MTTAIWWIRRDLRLHDNEALHAALRGKTAVFPLFILDPTLWQSDLVGQKRLAFLLDGLRALDNALRQRGSRLLLRQGRPEQVLAELVAATGATAVYAQADHTPYATTRDQRCRAAVPLQLVDSPAILPPGTVRKKDGDPYTVFTPFSRRWLAQPLPQRHDLLPAPAHIPTPAAPASDPLPDQPPLPPSVPFAAGEAEGRRQLAAFLQSGIDDYAKQRDFMAEPATSQLSPYLRFGMVSARETAVCALEARAELRDGATSWLNELIWRDFYINILHHFPHVGRGNFRPQWNHIRWRNDETEFAAWCAGETGYPIVDAAMRQLQQTGWMHNRARMIVASFLVKDLLINWRWGEQYFMQQLVDGDPAANNGGWQWAAGTGTDAAPYFRIFNPVAQSQKFDPNGRFIRRWLPELTNLSTKQIHQPWTLSAAQRQAAGCHSYPRPIVDHQEARARTLAAYKQAREQASGG